MAPEAAPLRWAVAGGNVIAAGGLLAIVGLAVLPGPLYSLALAIMVVGLAPVMLGFYGLGGRTPILPARIARTIGMAAVVVWSILLIAQGTGIVSFDESKAASGAFAIAAAAAIAFGAWLIGASALAGPWLSTAPRLLGMACGVGWVLAGSGLLSGGANHPLTYAGGIGYTFLFPIWGFLIGRRFATLRVLASY